MADLKRNGVMTFMAKGTEQVRAELKKMRDGVTGVDKETKTHTSSLGKVTTALKTAALAYASLYGAQKVMKWAQEGAAAKDVATSFQALAASANKSATSYLASMDAAAKGTVSRTDLMKKANYAMMLGMDADMSRIMEIARATAKATGQSVDYMTESLVVGIGRQSKLWLDNLGIIVDSEKAYTDLAKSLGVSVDSLTEAQRKMAFTNAAMAAGLVLVKKLGGTELETDPFNRLAASSKNLADTLKKELVPIVGQLAGGLADLMRKWDDYANRPESRFEKWWQHNFGGGMGPDGMFTGGAAATTRTWTSGRTGGSIANMPEPGLYPGDTIGPQQPGTMTPGGLSGADLAAAQRAWRRRAQDAVEARARAWDESQKRAQATMAGSGVPFAGGAPGGGVGGMGEPITVPPLVEPSDTENLLKHAEALGAVGAQMELVAAIGLRLKDHAMLAGEAMLFTKNSTDALGNAFAELIMGNGLALQQGLKFIAQEAAARLKAIASQASIEALWQTVLGLGKLAIGNVAGAGIHFKAAGMAAATAAAAGVAAGAIGRTVGTGGGGGGGFGGSSSSASSTGPASSSGGGSSGDTSVTRVSPTTVNIVIINNGPVYYGSQAEATVEAIQEILDTGQLVTGKQEVA